MQSSQNKSRNSYSQYRKRNSVSKGDLSKSLIVLQNSFNEIQNNKGISNQSENSTLNSLYQNLNKIKKIRSLSNSQMFKSQQIIPNAKNSYFENIPHAEKVKKIKISKLQSQINYSHPQGINQHPVQRIFHLDLNKNGNIEPIEQSSVFHEQNEEQFLQNTKQQSCKNKILMFKKNLIKKKQQAQPISISRKTSTITIDELNSMQKKLETIKLKSTSKITPNNKKSQERNQKLSFVQRNEKKVNNINTENNLEKLYKFKKIEINVNKETHVNKKESEKKVEMQLSFMKTSLMKNSMNIEGQCEFQQIIKNQSIKNQENVKNIHAENEKLIPTKMITLKEKQKILLSFDSFKQKIINNDISWQNAQKIQYLIKNLSDYIN